MKKLLVSVIGVILAIVLAVFFPDLRTSSTDDAAPTGSSNVEAGREATPRGSETTTPESTKAPAKKSVAAGTAADVSAKTNGGASGSAAPRSGDATKKGGTSEDSASSRVRRDVGFGSRQSFDDHFAKHGAEFGNVTQAQYLAMAQDLRDAPVAGHVLEFVREDGVTSRFDTKSGAFLAFNRNGTIRTFFKPNDGRRYFERQAEKDH